VVEFDNQQLIIKNYSPHLGQVLARRVYEGGLHKLVVDPIKHGTLVHSNCNLCQLRYRWLGHFHYGVLLVLKDMV
jgi:hypothetical protein